MRLLQSVGKLMVLSAGMTLAIAAQSYDGAQSMENTYTSEDNASARVMVDDGQPMLTPSQLGLVKRWARIKKANAYAKKLNMRVGMRVTLYLPKNRTPKLSEFGPNLKMDVMNKILNLFYTVEPDDPEAMYTYLPEDYEDISRQMNARRVRTTVVTTTSGARSADMKSSGVMDGSAVSGRSALMEESEPSTK
ncbi:hypothetical protein NEOKW01_1251 [Nematocida sp. AWRm80]|nr:hypothetical protein NEOKW01_1251 [Nematocida sp. AWRm80]